MPTKFVVLLLKMERGVPRLALKPRKAAALNASAVKSLTALTCTALVAKQTTKAIYPLVGFSPQLLLNLIEIEPA